MKNYSFIRLTTLITFVCILLVSGSAFASDPIIIGVPTSLGFLEGKEGLNAVNLAVEEINAAGGVKVGNENRMMVVKPLDIRDAAPGVPVPEALLGLEKLILESKPHAILVGPFRSEALLAGMDILAKHKVPMLVTIAMSPASGQKIKKNPEKYKYIFRVSSNAKYLVGLLLGSMKQLKDKFGFDKVYIMNQDVLWARGVSGAMNKLLPKQGWKVMGHDEFPTGASKFGPALTKVKIKGVQVIFTCFDMPQSGILVKQWKGMKVPSIMAGFISPMSGSAAWKTFNGNIGGFINSHFEIGNISSEKYKPATRFFDAYEKKYGKQIQAGHSPSSSYDAVYILKEAIEKTNSLNPDALVAALEKTDYTGASGKIKFDDEHQAVFGSDPTKTGAGCLFQWNEDGSRSIIYPPEVAEAEVKLPPWMKAVK